MLLPARCPTLVGGWKCWAWPVYTAPGRWWKSELVVKVLTVLGVSVSYYSSLVKKIVIGNLRSKNSLLLQLTFSTSTNVFNVSWNMRWTLMCHLSFLYPFCYFLLILQCLLIVEIHFNKNVHYGKNFTLKNIFINFWYEVAVCLLVFVFIFS